MHELEERYKVNPTDIVLENIPTIQRTHKVIPNESIKSPCNLAVVGVLLRGALPPEHSNYVFSLYCHLGGYAKTFSDGRKFLQKDHEGFMRDETNREKDIAILKKLMTPAAAYTQTERPKTSIRPQKNFRDSQ